MTLLVSLCVPVFHHLYFKPVTSRTLTPLVSRCSVMHGYITQIYAQVGQNEHDLSKSNLSYFVFSFIYVLLFILLFIYFYFYPLFQYICVYFYHVRCILRPLKTMFFYQVCFNLAITLVVKIQQRRSEIP